MKPVYMLKEVEVCLVTKAYQESAISLCIIISFWSVLEM